MNIEKENINRFCKIDDAMKGGVYLYGAGINGRWCLDYLHRIGIEVVGFIDSNCENQGEKINGINIISYNQYPQNSGCPILITAKHAVVEIMRYCDIDMMMSFDAWFILKHNEEYKTLKFDDEEGNRVLTAIQRCMLTGNEADLKDVICTNQYFWGFPFYNAGNESFVDLGACAGDTFEKFIWAYNGVFSHIYAFEPGVRQFQAAECRKRRLIAEWALDEDCITIERQLVGKENGVSFFNASGNIQNASRTMANEEDAISVNVVSIDSYFENKAVTFIKADIEGDEYEALLGAKNVIVSKKPKMAICVYHKPDDLLRIYFYLKQLVPDYRFTLRQHSSKLMDTVLYCWVE